MRSRVSEPTEQLFKKVYQICIITLFQFSICIDKVFKKTKNKKTLYIRNNLSGEAASLS